MSISERNWCDCVTIQNEVSMVDMNVTNVYREEWHAWQSRCEWDWQCICGKRNDWCKGWVGQMWNI